MITRKHEFGMMILLDRPNKELEDLSREGQIVAGLGKFGEKNPTEKVALHYLSEEAKQLLLSGETIRIDYGEGRQISIHYTKPYF